MTITQAFLRLAVWGLLCADCSNAADNSRREIKTTVCAISAHPERFDGKVVVFSGQFISDGIERSAVIDNSCQNYGIGIAIPEHFIGKDSWNKATRVGGPGTRDKTITGLFVGQFRWQPKQDPKRFFVLKEVRSVSVVMR